MSDFIDFYGIEPRYNRRRITEKGTL